MIKLRLCRYPNVGFGKRNNQWYLLNQYGTKYYIMDEYDKELKEMYACVTIENETYTAKTLQRLVEYLNTENNFHITKW